MQEGKGGDEREGRGGVAAQGGQGGARLRIPVSAGEIGLEEEEATRQGPASGQHRRAEVYPNVGSAVTGACQRARQIPVAAAQVENCLVALQTPDQLQHAGLETLTGGGKGRAEFLIEFIVEREQTGHCVRVHAVIIPSDHRFGFVAVVGRPNVGKSTLVNALLGQKIAAVSPRPQTTRRRQLGILTLERAQIVFVDTPGIHLPRHKLGEFFNQEAEEALENVDVILFLVDASVAPQEEDRRVARTLAGLRPCPPVILGLNKVDILPRAALEGRGSEYRALLEDSPARAVSVLAFSATAGQGLPELLAALLERLPPGPPQYPPEQVTDLYEREIAADLIREAALRFLRDEVPHALAVRIDEYKERGESGAYVAATLFVERESQKGIVIGAEGAMLRKIGSAARQEIEAMSGRKVFLELRVKVAKGWRNDEAFLRRVGYRLKRTKRKT